MIGLESIFSSHFLKDFVGRPVLFLLDIFFVGKLCLVFKGIN